MTDPLLQNAWQQHQAGHLAEAARLYDHILRVNPKSFDALQLLGVLHMQRGEFADAERILGNAVKLNPASGDALYNRGCALLAIGRFQDAVLCFDKALAINLRNIPAIVNRGNALLGMQHFEEALASYDHALGMAPASAEALLNRGNTLFELQRYDQAIESYDRALALTPNDPVIWNNRGNVLATCERPGEALECFNIALRLAPDYADALENRGNALVALRRYDEALADFDRAIHLQPARITALYARGLLLRTLKRYDEALASFNAVLTAAPGRADAWIGCGIVLLEMNRNNEAVACFDAVLEAYPGNPAALSNRAGAFLRIGRPDAALVDAERAIAADPERADAWHNRGSAFAALKNHEGAIQSYERALNIAPGYAITWADHGIALVALRRDEDALPYFEKALSIDPNSIDALSGRANALANLNRLIEAVEDCEKALAIEPDDSNVLSVLVHCRLPLCDWRFLEQEKAKIAAGLLAGRRSVLPLDNKAISDSEEDHFRCTRLWTTEECPPVPALWRGEHYIHDKIRIAYISADFRDHVVAFLIADVFEHHDKNRFEITAISLGADDGSKTRARMATSFDTFIDATDKSDAEAASIIRDAEIDIAIDLNGHTSSGRPRILSYRPAPVAVNFLGYPGTMAADYMDYIVADRTVVPEANAVYYSEKPAYLPDCYLPHDSKQRISERTPSRAEAGLPERGFVFCSFNYTYKFLPAMFDVWMRLLTDAPDSVLWLRGVNETATANLKREAEARGVSPDRLIFAPMIPLREDHLARLRLANLFLDTLPYNAHATAHDALWAGVPVLTCMGHGFAGRVAASQLKAAGLPEMITESLAAYEALALRLAREPSLLAEIRAKLARNREAAPLFDTARFTRNLEAAYTHMWERSRRGEPPQGFTVAT